MAKAPSESRIPTFGSRIPIPGKFRFQPNFAPRTATNVKSPLEADRTITIPPTRPETMSPPANTQQNCNKTITLSKASENCNTTIILPKTSENCNKTIFPEASENCYTTIILPKTSENFNKTIILPKGSENCNKTVTLPTTSENFVDLNCTVTLNTSSAEATFVLKNGAREKTPTQTAALQPASSEPTVRDVGKRVSVGSAQYGTLKYVGEVSFGAGLWCGVELDEAVGKHDGFVKGVRYFTCRANCGLLAPINKINKLHCDSTFEKDIDQGEPSLLDVHNVRVNLDETFDALNCDELNTTVVLNKDVRAEQNLVAKINSESVKSVPRKSRMSIKTGNFVTSKLNLNSTISLYTPTSNDSFGVDVCASTPTSDRTKFKKKNVISENFIPMKGLELNKTPAPSPVQTPSLTKQNSFEADESLGILTPDQMVDFSAFVRNGESVSSDALKSILTKHNDKISRTPSSENLGTLPRDGSQLNLNPTSSENSITLNSSKIFGETLTISSPEQIENISDFDSTIMPSSVPMSLPILENSNIQTNTKLTTPSRTPSSENLCSELKYPTNSITYSSRMLDESSLMILSPEQMASMLGSSKTPSSTFLMSKRSDKTISNSRIPSSENLGSLPHDGFKQPLHLLEPMESDIKEEDSLPLSRPFSIDLKSTSDPLKSFKLSASLQAELSSPNAVENSIIDFSLGLIEEDLLATGNQFSSMIDTTTNLELPLDSISGDKNMPFKSLSRSDQTPSPEDLPLDPIDPIKPIEMEIIEPNLLIPTSDSDSKTDVSKSTTTTKTNSFITSVTSITSLDTGYQGDGEMSRPASRGADHSPMAHKPINPALVNLQWQRAISRRQDPMTDSDFFTESDADIHEDNAPKGDRRAQVIDGTLYGVNAQAPGAQDIFIGNQEEMDSSGVFTDLDNPRADDFSDGERNRVNVVNEDKSPSEISTKSITENSQEIKEPEDLQRTLVNENHVITIMDTTESISENPKSPTQSIISNPSSRKSVRSRTPQSKDENPNKKFKMPKRNVTSKVKTMMEQQKLENQENRKPTRKTTNRWDAVMNKISQGKEEASPKQRLKEVKSKVSCGIGSSNTNIKAVRKPEEAISSAKTKIRRVRGRGDSLSTTKISRTTSSVNSSLSDLSVSQISHSNKQHQSHASTLRVTKKREAGLGRCAAPVTEVLTPGGHKPTPVTSSRTTLTVNSQRTTKELKKFPTVTSSVATDKASSGRQPSSRRPGANSTAICATKTTSTAAKDQTRVTGVGPQTQKGASPLKTQVLQEKTPSAANLLPQLCHSAKGVEALGVLVQYLVFNLDAFRTPSLKRELEIIRTQWIRDKLELEETRMGYRRLEDAVSEQKILAAQTIEEERIKYRAEITEIFEKQRRDFADLSEKTSQEKAEIEERLTGDIEELQNQLDAEISNREHEIAARIEAYVSEHRYRLQELEQENEKLRRDHQISVEILREENESIREQMDEKTSLIEDLKEYGFINEKLKKELTEKEKIFEDKIIAAQDEIALLKEENKKILETFKSDTKDNKLQNGIGSPDKCSVVGQAALGRCTQLQDEVESLRTVLDLKLAELSELRRAHGELSQAAEELPAALLRAQTLQARVEDLELQLERKTDMEVQLAKENKRLQDSFSQESKQNKRLTLYNEELQWKLKQNSEVVNAILQGQTPNRKSLHGSNQSLTDDLSFKTPTGGYLSRSLHTSSFNEKHHGTSTHILEHTLSFRERKNNFLKDTPSRKLESQSPNDRFHNKPDYFDLDDSPPSSPKVKGVVEKSDSVSWVLDMDESPEVIASRMVRRAGSFRNVTPPKSTPTKSPASKRPRTKANNLSLSASAGAIVSPEDKNDNRYRSKSVSLRDTHSQSPEACHPGEYLSNSWHYSLRTSTPNKSGLETIRNSVKLENNPDLEHDSDVTISLPALPSEITRKKDCKPDSLPSLPSGDLLLLQSSFPKTSAGEAMISESNSEDECSSSTSERSPSVSDTETSEEPTGGGGSISAVVEKCASKKMQYDLFLLSESATTSEAMDCSWSEELDV